MEEDMGIQEVAAGLEVPKEKGPGDPKKTTPRMLKDPASREAYEKFKAREQSSNNSTDKKGEIATVE